MAEGKWITELSASTPLADAARRVLTVRLAVVHEYLPLAMREADKDPEHVHQLRVSTRRAAAALEIFTKCLPDKDYKRARKTLKRIRRAAGEARDWDVFLLGLPAGPGSSARLQAGKDLVVGYAVARRAAAQDILADASPNYPFDFERFQADTVAALHKPHGHSEPHTLADLAQPMLSGFLQELHEAASGDLSNYEHLHQVRIIGKRLRYAMEVFVACFAEEFREKLYPQVEQMQEILGQANDSHVASQRLQEVLERLRISRPGDWRRFKPGIDALRRQHEQRVARQGNAFSEWWKNWQETGGEAAFAALIHKKEENRRGPVAPEIAVAPSAEENALSHSQGSD
jgi:CHAD domain-containing protein